MNKGKVATATQVSEELRCSSEAGVMGVVEQMVGT